MYWIRARESMRRRGCSQDPYRQRIYDFMGELNIRVAIELIRLVKAENPNLNELKESFEKTLDRTS